MKQEWKCGYLHKVIWTP